MKVKYIKDRANDFLVNGNRLDCSLTPGKVYEASDANFHGWYKIVDDSGEEYMYPPELFEVVEN